MNVPPLVRGRIRKQEYEERFKSGLFGLGAECNLAQELAYGKSS